MVPTQRYTLSMGVVTVCTMAWYVVQQHHHAPWYIHYHADTTTSSRCTLSITRVTNTMDGVLLLSPDAVIIMVL